MSKKDVCLIWDSVYESKNDLEKKCQFHSPGGVAQNRQGQHSEIGPVFEKGHTGLSKNVYH